MGIDYADAMVSANVQRALDTAKRILEGSVGDFETYAPGDERARELVLMYADDLYSERGVSAKVSGAVRKLAETMENQLRLEIRRAKEAAADAV
jgi:GTPase